MIPVVWEIDTEVSTKEMIDDRGGGSTETAEILRDIDSWQSVKNIPLKREKSGVSFLLMITFSVGWKFSAFNLLFIPPERLQGIGLEVGIRFDKFWDKVIEEA